MALSSSSTGISKRTDDSVGRGRPISIPLEALGYSTLALCFGLSPQKVMEAV